MSSPIERQREEWYDFVRRNNILTPEQAWREKLREVQDFINRNGGTRPRDVEGLPASERRLAVWVDAQMIRFGHPDVIPPDAREKFAEVQQATAIADALEDGADN